MSNLPGHTTVESISEPNRATAIVPVADLFDGSGGSDEVSLKAVIQQLQAALESIPIEHRDTAVLQLHTYGDDASAYLNVTFTRPETDDELADRRRWLDSIQTRREADERRTFEHLKAKFGK